MVQTSTGAGRAVRRVIIAVLVLVVFVLAVDRVGNYIAEQTTASTLQDSQNLTHKPDVSIGGFPFLTQLATGKFDQVSVDAADVPIGGQGVTLTFTRLQVTLDHVTADRSFRRFHVQHASAIGTISYPSLSDSLGADLSYAGEGRVRAKKTITILGQSFTPTITAAPEIVDGALSFGKAQVNGLGALSGQVSRVLAAVFDVKPLLQNIPFQIDVQKLSMTKAGLRIDLVGSDIDYVRQHG